MYHIQNGYQNWEGGYLDTCGLCSGNYLQVSTSPVPDRDRGSGTWQILSANGKQTGDVVLANDVIYLLNQWAGGGVGLGGYLDTYGMSGDDYLDVSTSEFSNRDQGSGTWRILTELSGGPVNENDVVHLMNGYTEWNGGFLDSCGFAPQPNLYNAATSKTWNRIEGSTLWRLAR
jgi:hypothetical protein